MTNELRELAMATLEKEDYQNFASALYNEKDLVAQQLVEACYDKAQQEVLDSVYKDECDFVLFSHYRNARNLLEMSDNIEDYAGD